ncbi:MAG: fibronectin type III domain-containing protein [Acidobacteria bacterium]|nr:fibronectin type III domain-containing protein [Acidobacteriota bacterium]
MQFARFSPVLALLAFTLAAQSLPAPDGLTVVSATRSAVQLAWGATTAPAYLIERKTLDGDYATLATSEPNSYTDRTIDPFTTYLYRVRSTQPPASSSDPTREVTVGPPPVGLSVASPLAAGVANYALEAEYTFGVRLRAVLDSNGDPALAYQVVTPSPNDAQSAIEFVSWNRALYQWNPPVKAAVTGDNGGTRPFSLARDASTNAWAIAWHTSSNGAVRIAISRDNGATWSEDLAFDCGENSCLNSAMGLRAGSVYLAFQRSYDGIKFLTGKLDDPPSSWAARTLPLPSRATDARHELDLGIDSAGKPAVAFWANSDDYNVILGLWRESTGTVTVMDTNGLQSDTTYVGLNFFGTQARLITDARRNDAYYERYDQNLWFSAERSGAFPPPASLPADGNQYLGYPSLAIGSDGQATIAATETGGNLEGVSFGIMKLLKSADLNSWSIGSPIVRGEELFTSFDYPNALYASNDKLYVAFTSASSAGSLAGVLLWRER